MYLCAVSRTLPFDEFVKRASQESNVEHFFCPVSWYNIRNTDNTLLYWILAAIIRWTYVAAGREVLFACIGR